MVAIAGSEPPDVVTFGEAMISVMVDGRVRLGGSAHVSVAGAEANVAIGLARLGHAVRWAGPVGDDEPGAFVLRTLRAEGVDVSHARVDARRPTGLMLREQRVGDIARVSYYRSRSAGSHLSPADVTAVLGPPPRVLHVTGITPALGERPRAAVSAAVTAARGSGVATCLDV